MEFVWLSEGEREVKEIDNEQETEIGKELNSVSTSDSLSITVGFSQQVVVGYALTTKKKKSFLQPKLEVIARDKGILFVPIDQHRPLVEQGPFDVVLHKLLGNEWIQLLENHALYIISRYLCLVSQEFGQVKDYRLKHPDVMVLDPPNAIQCVQNRQSMLEDVAALNLSDSCGRVCVPKQLVVKKDPSLIPAEVAKAGLKLPLVAKPLFVDGSAKAHELFLAYDNVSLSNLEPPLVLQEFVNHGGVMFKVYVVGNAIKVVRRFSLPDVCKRELSKYAGVFQFPRVSGAAASAEEADLDPGVAELPPRPLLERLVGELRRRMGLQLFNIDIIREHGTRDLFYVIDINYFPGYGKMPGYEHIFTDFLASLGDIKYRKQLCI
ncbi:Inositol-tetrakisphosphate 1-kinase 3 [Bienertia sinuspersici]